MHFWNIINNKLSYERPTLNSTHHMTPDKISVIARTQCYNQEYKCFSLLAVLESNVSLLSTHFDMIATSKSIIEGRTNYGPIRL